MPSIRSVALLGFATVLLAASPAAQPPTPPGGAVPRIDGSSERAHRISVAKVKRTLDRPDLAKFDQALKMARQVFGSSYLQRVHGATAEELFDLRTAALERFDANRNGKIDRSELRKMSDLLSGARAKANESAAIATLLNIASAQAQFQAMGVVDVNFNGFGEYGYFGELNGKVGLREVNGKAGPNRISPPVLSKAFAVKGGLVERSGYLFQVWLPDADGRGVAEGSRGGVGGTAPDAGRTERTWCAYAWPVTRGETGNRAFFVSHDGVVHATDNEKQRYSGRGKAPDPHAAMARGNSAIGPLPRRVKKHNDGGTWKRER